MESRFFFCLIAGVLLAFTFQGTGACLSAAMGLSVHGRGGRHPGKLGARLGIWVLLSTCASLFFAAWAATALFRFGTPGEAVILGLTIWAAFTVAMLWLKTAAMGSLFGAIIGLSKARPNGFGSALAGESPNAAEGTEPAAIASQVREEFRNRRSGHGIRDRLHAYLDKMGVREPDRFEIDREANGLFEDEELRNLARLGELHSVDRTRFRELVASRGDITEEESGQWAEALYGRWNGMREESRGSEAADASGTAGTLPGAEAGVVEAQAGAASIRVPEEPGEPVPVSGAKHPERAGETAKSETVITVPAGFKERLQGFKDFLRNSDRRELNPARLEQEVEILVANPEENLAGIEKRARSTKREEVVQVLKQRRDLSPQEADSIADLIDSARTRTLSRSEMREHRMQEATNRAMARLRDRIYGLKRPERDYAGFRRDVEHLLYDSGTEDGIRAADLEGLDRQALFEMFFGRRGISKQDAERMAEGAELALLQAREVTGQIEAESRRRVEAARLETAARAESARKLTASAAWWLFGINVATGTAAALGGYLGSKL